MIDKFILDNYGRPVRESDLHKWAQWFETAKRHVAQDTIGPSRVSTVFLGLDHAFEPNAQAPILWETMVFGGPLDQEQDRCSGSRKEAQLMHARTIEKVKQAGQA
jgi:hypothetical protein